MKRLAILAILMSSLRAQYTVSTVAGGGRLKIGDSAKAAFVSNLGGVAWDALGRFYLSADNRVYRVNTSGVVDLIVGNGVRGFGGDGGPAMSLAVEFGSILGLDRITCISSTQRMLASAR
jgi:hypothetical protein